MKKQIKKPTTSRHNPNASSIKSSVHTNPNYGRHFPHSIVYVKVVGTLSLTQELYMCIQFTYFFFLCSKAFRQESCFSFSGHLHFSFFPSSQKFAITYEETSNLKAVLIILHRRPVNTLHALTPLSQAYTIVCLSSSHQTLFC